MTSPEPDWLPAPERPGPLSGLKVLDLSRILAGPYATMQLADLGADVVKVESPDGDETRRWGPPFTEEGTSTYYLAVNRNKRSVVLDLRRGEDVEVCRRMALAADVVVENFLPGRLARFGLDLDGLRAESPRLVTASINGFGRENAYADRPGFDFIAQAMGGMMAVTGPAGGEPTRVGVAIADLGAGLYLCQGVLAALHERERTGHGRHVEVALLDAQVAMLVNLASAWVSGGVATEPFGNAHPTIAPYETLRTADRPIAVAVGTDRQFLRLVEELERPELADDPRFSTNPERVRHRDELRGELESVMVRRPREHWLEVLVAAGVPVGPVNTIPEVFADPVIAQRMLGEVDDVAQVRSPLRLEGEPLPMTSAPPALGEHTGEILAWVRRRPTLESTG